MISAKHKYDLVHICFYRNLEYFPLYVLTAISQENTLYIQETFII
jgi:hypothetical protein